MQKVYCYIKKNASNVIILLISRLFHSFSIMFFSIFPHGTSSLLILILYIKYKDGSLLIQTNVSSFILLIFIQNKYGARTLLILYFYFLFAFAHHY